MFEGISQLALLNLFRGIFRIRLQFEDEQLSCFTIRKIVCGFTHQSFIRCFDIALPDPTEVVHFR